MDKPRYIMGSFFPETLVCLWVVHSISNWHTFENIIECFPLFTSSLVKEVKSSKILFMDTSDFLFALVKSNKSSAYIK